MPFAKETSISIHPKLHEMSFVRVTIQDANRSIPEQSSIAECGASAFEALCRQCNYPKRELVAAAPRAEEEGQLFIISRTVRMTGRHRLLIWWQENLEDDSPLAELHSKIHL